MCSDHTHEHQIRFVPAREPNADSERLRQNGTNNYFVSNDDERNGKSL